jgi:peroxin-5
MPSAEQQSCDDLYDKGMQYYTEGHVDEAILAFEGAIQTHPENGDNVTVSENSETVTAVDEIWNMLGKCHAEMDKDLEAIFCYQQALEYDPFNLSALLALGTSHVNEMNSVEALECLQGWVKHNPKFHGLEARLKKQYNTDTADDVYAGPCTNLPAARLYYL